MQRNTTDVTHIAQPELDRLKARFFIEAADIQPRVFLRITDNWVEVAVCFLCGTHDVRGLKNLISRELLAGLEVSNIGITSSTYDSVGFPPIRLDLAGKIDPPSAIESPELKLSESTQE